MERKKIKKGKMDYLLLFSIIGLLVIGIIMVYSSSYFSFAYEKNDPNALFRKELGFAAMGLVGMYLVSKISMNSLRRLALPVNILTLLTYLLLWTPLGWRFRGGLRWVRLAGVTFMPSEFAKYAIILACAYVLTCKKEERNGPIYYFMIFCSFIYIPLTAIQPDMSSTLIIAVALFAVLFLGGLNLIYIFMLGFGSVAAASLAILYSGFRRDRVKVFLDPFSDPTGKGFQVLQSLYAVASGGFQGKGLGNGVQKMLYLPLAYNDYIFSIYAEELGFIGSIILIILLSILVLRGFKIAANGIDKFSLLVAGGITAHIAVQAIMNMYVSVSLFPSTGIPFPIISYGGTSLITTLMGLGILLGASRHEIAPPSKAYEKIERKDYYSLERREKIQ